jgi:hypothetical protein
MLAVNPVVALWMEQDAVFYTRRTTFHTGNAIVNAPARDPGDLGVAHGAEPALERPEKAKSPRTPKRFRHMVSFAFLPSGQPPLLGAGPLRTGLESFPSSGSSIQ